MDEVVANPKHVQPSTWNHDTEPKQPKVLSRYLRGSPGSCHDHCKSGIIHGIDTKPITPFPKGVAIAPSVKTKVNHLYLGQKLRKDDAFNPKVINSKPKPIPKSKPALTKAFSLPSMRIPKTRPGKVIVDSGLACCTSPIASSSNNEKDNKTSKSRKSLMLSSSSTVFCPKPPSNGKSTKKTPPMSRTFNTVPNSKLKDSRKSNPTKPPVEEIQEKTLVEVNNGDDEATTASEHPDSSVSSISEDKIRECSQNGSQVAEPSTEKTKKVTRVRNMGAERKYINGPTKLKFNHGKVIDSRCEDNTPRKHDIKQGKVLGKEQKPEDRRLSLRRRTLDGVSQASLKTHSVKVVLKHQANTEDKVPLSLFNNVIEETASKLIQTRKSKVKALVGAFEHVITRQDLET